MPMEVDGILVSSIDHRDNHRPIIGIVIVLGKPKGHMRDTASIKHRENCLLIIVSSIFETVNCVWRRCRAGFIVHARDVSHTVARGFI